MKKNFQYLAQLALATLLGVAVQAAELSGQEKALAIAAARADAEAQLIGSIQGLQISEKSTVANFVLEQGKKAAATAGLIKGVVFDDPVQVDDMVLITGTITLDQVVENLNRRATEYSNGKTESFESVKRFNQQSVLKARGRGTRKSPDQGGGNHPDADGILDTLKRLKGTGQEKLGATEAARLDGLAQLAQQIKGVQISDHATCFNMALDGKWTEAASSAVVRGARVVRYTANGDDLVSCIIQIDLQNIVENVHKSEALFSNGETISFESIKRYNPGIVTVTATGWGAIGKDGPPGSSSGGPTGVLGRVQ